MTFSNLPSSQAYSLLVTDPVGVSPYGTTFDPNTGNIYVANSGDNTVSMINTATNNVIAIPVGTTPLGVAAGNGNVYVANDGSNTVSVISDANNTVTATIPVGGTPGEIAFDSTAGNVYISIQDSNSVLVMNGGKSVNSIPVGNNPYGVAIGNGNVYVANLVDGTVSVISVASNTVTATIPVGTYPIGIAFDHATGNVYVANYGSNTVSVISVASNTVTESISGVSSPTWLTFDPANNNLYVADSATNAVSVISTAAPLSKSTTSLSSSQNPSAAGQAVTFTASVSPSTATGTVQLSIDGTTTGSPVTITGGQAVITLPMSSVGTHQITATYSGDTLDASSTSPVLTQTVNQVITTTAVTSSQNPLTSGQSVTFTASVSSSIATGTVQFFIDGVAVGSPLTLIGDPQVTFTLPTLSAGTHQITATYSGDANDTSSTSAALTQTVNQVINGQGQTPTQKISTLIKTVGGMSLNHGLTDKLDNDLNAAINSLNSGSNSGAITNLNNFISDVNSPSISSKLTATQVSQLVTGAQNIISTITGILK